jgi:hypothetical protein
VTERLQWGENSTYRIYQPLRLIAANDFDLVEIYPSRSELTETVAARMDTNGKCRAEGLLHLTHYVLWLTGSK